MPSLRIPKPVALVTVTAADATLTVTAVAETALTDGADQAELRGFDLGPIGIEGILVAALAGDAAREFFLTDNPINTDFRIIDVSGAPHLYYVGRDSGDFEAGCQPAG